MKCPLCRFELHCTQKGEEYEIEGKKNSYFMKECSKCHSKVLVSDNDAVLLMDYIDDVIERGIKWS